jgi:hypothetical protein
MHVQLARLAVLYEDLQIEFAGANEDSLQPLDRTDRNTRRFYFVRRTLGTLVEVGGALHKLNMNPEFKRIKRGMKKGERQGWDSAAKFFSKKHEFLNHWRNDIGGHFLDRAAEFAVSDIHEKTVGVIEVYRRGSGADVKMPFAYELVAVAMTRARGAKTEDEFLNEAFTFLRDAVRHAISAIQIVTAVYLFDRFV